MRDYLTLPNLRAALALGTLITVMSVPRIVQGGMDVMLYVPAALTSMTLVAGAATAWSRQGGMCGLFPERRRMWIGIGIAAALSLLALPLGACLAPVFEDAMRESMRPERVELHYPATAGGCFASMLWAASFETMFFSAAATSLLARLSRRQWVAVSMTTVLRLGVTWRTLALTGVVDAQALFYATSGTAAFIGALLFARAGLPATMVFAAGLQLHLFLHLR